jgi:predicted DNA-binding transcriptional regulator AlpA
VGSKCTDRTPSRILWTVTLRKLLRVVEIAEILGVSKQRADRLRREPDFPAPVDRWARGDLWAAADIRRWARTYAGGVVGSALLAAARQPLLPLSNPTVTVPRKARRYCP